MNVASLPVILYVLPVFMLLAAFSHPQWKRDALALGGLCFVYVTGGTPALFLLSISVSLTWLVLRLSPRKSSRHPHRAEAWMYCGIGIQVLILLLARMLIGSETILPLLLCTLQGSECLAEYAARRLKTPPLHAFFCYQCDMTRLPAGPVLKYETAVQLRAERQVTAKRVGSGAARCIRGLFQLVCLALPMFGMQNALKIGTVLRSSADAVLAAVSFYFFV